MNAATALVISAILPSLAGVGRDVMTHQRTFTVRDAEIGTQSKLRLLSIVRDHAFSLRK
jgi:hypothetical protein